ncbi:PREDICTED: kinesin-like protein KIF23 [Dufourea novaeangliae]|uniref:kinesin-like protein KIF23 n=1 Tax=Dufourea novaeangliae TaxID=178035 RepID=UPI0007673AA9|nr:PREDICTED: kinesin-like protein KIF23 [Dufourea novaeangliae]
MKSTNSKPPAATRKCTNRPKYDSVHKESVKVFCRLRPMAHPNDVSCMRIISDTNLIITPPESVTNIRNANRIIQTSFSHVFSPNASQKEVFDLVALPLVENLINGKNSLLFTYGITGSGKTYTMSGNLDDAGIMPRSLDVIFNSIAHCQAKKFIFKPDKLNGFDVQSETDALLDRQNELQKYLFAQNGKTPKQTKSDDEANNNEKGLTQTSESQTLIVDEDNAYAVFVTYVEIYNNSVYDLLEDNDGKAKTVQSKIIREDGNRNMYIHGCTEVEVKSSEEAFEVFQRGQCKRHIAYTVLNAESSRSHSVFTIRLVQAPLDMNGEQVVQDKRILCVSQLSLVDLAGSERTNRSKNTGQRLREAGNINNSLMTLRTCLEILRENQTQGSNKIVPYRDSKVTHLFKNYFDGEGIVRMIVCVNPRVDDYDEAIQVMKFAEVSQEVQVTNSGISKLDLGYTPGRRQANKIFKEAKNRLESAGNPAAGDLEVDLGLVYSLGGPFPDTDLSNPHNDEIITTLMRFLEMRIQKRNILQEDLKQKQTNFRNMLVKTERDNVSLRIENSTLKTSNDQQKKKISALEAHICKTESQIDTLLYRLNSANDIIRHMKEELKNKDMLLNQRAIDKQRVKEKYNSKIQMENDKMSKELESKLRRQREILQSQMKEKDQKLKLMKRILTNDDDAEQKAESTESIPAATSSDTDVPTTSKPTTSPTTIPEITSSITTTPKTSMKTPSTVKFDDASDLILRRTERIPVVNLRYRRSQSAERWVDHRPSGLVPVGTIFQPRLRQKRSVTQLTDPKDITEGVSRYCLVAQEQDTDGELETKLYKGDILPTSGGGAQVVFNDMEHLKQVSPVTRRKRSNYYSPEKKDSALQKESGGLEDHNTKKPRV